MWRQLIDRSEAWPETSSTGMFTFAMITGVKNGWPDEDTYGPAARKAWLALVGYVDQNANVTNVCVGRGKKNDRDTTLHAHGTPATCTGRRPFSGVHQRYCASSVPESCELTASLHLSGVPAVSERQKTLRIESLGLARGEELSVRFAMRG